MKPGKHRETRSYVLEEAHVLTSKEIVERTLNSLGILGKQRFAVAPFYEHFDRWLLSLRTIISDFQSSPAIAVDDEFERESSNMLSDVEQALKERRLREVSREEALRMIDKNLLDARNLLAQTEREYAAKVKELTAREELAVKPVAGRAAKMRQELSRIIKLRAGFLRGISKKAKAQKEAEAAQILDSTRRELTRMEQAFATERSKLQDEYTKRRRQISQEIANHQKKIEDLETGIQIDDALDARRAACDALVKSLTAFTMRNQQASQSSNPF